MKKEILISFLLSIILNFSVVFFFGYFFERENLVDNSATAIPIILSNTFKRVGIKGGKKEFTLPVKNSLTSPSFLKKEINLANINAGNNFNILTVEKKRSLVKLSEVSRDKIALKNSVRMQKLHRELLKEFSDEDKNFLTNNTKLKFIFELPEGVSENELNSADKEFYGFYKRAGERYFSSIIRTFREMSVNTPYLSTKLKFGKKEFKGRVVFDKDGNIVMIKITKGSINEYAQNLFENILKNIGPLYNPPNSLISKNSDMTFYFVLNLL